MTVSPHAMFICFFCIFLLLRREKPLKVEHEDLYRRSRWEDPPHPAHRMRPVSPHPRPGQALPEVPMASLPQQVSEWTMPSTQPDGSQQYGMEPCTGYRPNSMHQWHASHPQCNSQWVQPQAPAMSQGDMACMSQNMGMSFGAMQMNPLPIHQWQQASPWNQIVPQQAIPQVPVQNDAMLHQALLAALAQRQLEEQCALAEASQKAKAHAENKARPSQLHFHYIFLSRNPCTLCKSV